MNEGIDMALMGAKIASSKNQAASIAVHAISASYSIAQMAYYRAMNAELMNVQPSGGVHCVDIRNQYRRELLKHTVLTGLDVFSLFMIGLSGYDWTVGMGKTLTTLLPEKCSGFVSVVLLGLSFKDNETHLS